MNTVRVCGGVAAAIVAVSVPQVVVDDAVTAAPARVVLGVSQGKYSMGYGEVRPSTLTSNSMCANVISKIKWTSWVARRRVATASSASRLGLNIAVNPFNGQRWSPGTSGYAEGSAATAN